MKSRRSRSVQLTQKGIAQIRQRMREMRGTSLPPINLANLANVTLKELSAYQQGESVYPAIANQIEAAQAKISRPWTYEVLAAAANVSETTIKRILGVRKDKNPQRLSVASVAQALNLDPVELVLPGAWEGATASETTDCPENLVAPRQDWGDAPDIPFFVGRDEDLALLTQWITCDRARLIAIVGIGGVGKTGLSVKLGRGGIGKTDLSLELAKDVSSDFDAIIWRSLLGAPTPEKLLFELIQFLCDGEFICSMQLSEQITQLIDCMKRQRCLIVLDNLETVLYSDKEDSALVSSTGDYQEGYEGYGLLLRKVSEVPHQSCVLLTSREKPRDLEKLSGKNRLVHFYHLSGLDSESGQEIFSQLGSFCATPTQWQSLVDMYDGNPLILEIVANHIRDVFFGDVANFLAEGNQCFDDIYTLLDSFCQRLSESELDIAYWLALNRSPTSYDELKDDLLSIPAKNRLSSTLQSLQRRLPIERSASGFALQPVLIEYLTARLIAEIGTEILVNSPNLLNCYALLKASGKDYIREIQKKLVLKPLLQNLLDHYGTAEKLAAQCKQTLLTLQIQSTVIPGYAAGNLINLLSQAKVSLEDWDLSNLALWQADLRTIKLHNVNLANSYFQKTVFSETNHEIFTVACSRDGRLIAAGDGNSNIYLWNSTTNKQTAILKGHTYWVWSVAFSPDTHFLASGSFDGTIRIWEIATAQCLQVLEGHQSWVWSVVFSADGKTLLSCGRDGAVYCWQLSDGSCDLVFQSAEPIYAIALSPDNHTLVFGGEAQILWLWDLKAGKCRRQITSSGGTIWTLALSPNGQCLATGHEDGIIRLREISSGHCIRDLRGHTAPVWSVAFSADGQTLASGSHDQTIKLWNLSTGHRLNTLQGHQNWIWSLAFSADDQTIVSGSEDQSLKVWHAQTGQCLQTFQGYVNWIRCVCYIDGGCIVSGSESGSVDLWEVSSGQHLDTLYQGEASVRAIATALVSGQGAEFTCLAVGTDDGQVRLWDLSRRQYWFSIQTASPKVSTLQLSPDGRILVHGGTKGKLQLWHLPTQQQIATWQAHSDWTCTLAFSSDGQKFVSGGADGLIKLWETASGQCLKVIEAHTIWAYTVAFSPDDRLIASGGNDQTFRIWAADTGQCLACIENLDTVRVVSFSPDGRQIAIGTDNRSVLIWDLEQQDWIQSLKGHTNAITDLAFSPNGLMLLTSSQDETLKVWSLKTGECLQTMCLRKLYDGANMRGVVGLNPTQRTTLSSFGAIL